jgi:hypothetical protein
MLFTVPPYSVYHYWTNGPVVYLYIHFSAIYLLISNATRMQGPQNHSFRYSSLPEGWGVLLHNRSVPHSTVYSFVTQKLSSTQHCIQFCYTNTQFHTALYTVVTKTLSSTRHCIQFSYTNTQFHTALYTVLLHKHSVPHSTVYSLVTQTLSSTQHCIQFCYTNTQFHKALYTV